MGRKQRIANTSDKLNINTAEASIVLLLLVSGRYYGVLIEEADSNRAWSMQVNPCDVGFESHLRKMSGSYFINNATLQRLRSTEHKCKLRGVEPRLG
jgi:hypothetical protein